VARYGPTVRQFRTAADLWDSERSGMGILQGAKRPAGSGRNPGSDIGGGGEVTMEKIGKKRIHLKLQSDLLI